MAKRGPQPNPNSLRSRTGRNTYVPPRKKERIAPAIKPEWLDSEASAFWDRNAPYLRKRGHLNRLFETAFAQLCMTWSHLQQSREMIEREGKILTSPRGRLYPHPAVSILKAESRMFAEMCKSFGLNPNAAQRIAIAEEEELDDFERLMSKRDRMLARRGIQ